MVAQGYTQVKGIDFYETFSLVVRLEFLRLLLSIACHIGFKLFQMDVKNTFLNSILHKEVYVELPKVIEDPHSPNHVYKLNKDLCMVWIKPYRLGMKGWQISWLKKVIREEELIKLFLSRHFDSDIIITQIYVDNFVFCSTLQSKVQEFVNQIKQEFEMSMVGELNFFPRLIGKEIWRWDFHLTE